MRASDVSLDDSRTRELVECRFHRCQRMRKKRKHWLKRRRRVLHNARICLLVVWLLVYGLAGVGRWRVQAKELSATPGCYGLRNQTQLS